MLQHKVRFVGLPDVLIKSKSKICLDTSLNPFVDEVFPRLFIVRMLIVPPCGAFCNKRSICHDLPMKLLKEKKKLDDLIFFLVLGAEENKLVQVPALEKLMAVSYASIVH